MTTSTRDGESEGTETFALYGFKLRVPNTWRVEFNPKGDRLKGEVAFHTPKRNTVFLAWGPLEEANRSFKTLAEQRDWGVARIAKTRGIQGARVAESKSIKVCGHEALVTSIVATPSGGLLSRKQPSRIVMSMHLHCPEMSRFYVLYVAPNDVEEYPDFSGLFNRVAQSFACHGPSE
jgi:hypothetical protein